MSESLTDLINSWWESPYWNGFAHICGGLVFGGFGALFIGQSLLTMYDHILASNYDPSMLIASLLIFGFFALGFVAACALMLGGLFVGAKTLWSAGSRTRNANGS